MASCIVKRILLTTILLGGSLLTEFTFSADSTHLTPPSVSIAYSKPYLLATDMIWMSVKDLKDKLTSGTLELHTPNNQHCENNTSPTFIYSMFGVGTWNQGYIGWFTAYGGTFEQTDFGYQIRNFQVFGVQHDSWNTNNGLTWQIWCTPNGGGSSVWKFN